MLTFDEMETMLDEIACEIPKELYRELNGGIILLPETKLHPQSQSRQHGVDSLYIMGEYHNDRKGYGGLGRYIVIYYGSFARVHPHLGAEQLRIQIKNTLIHEFTHHIESLAGVRDLEIKDAQNLYNYKKKIRIRRS